MSVRCLSILPQPLQNHVLFQGFQKFRVVREVDDDKERGKSADDREQTLEDKLPISLSVEGEMVQSRTIQLFRRRHSCLRLLQQGGHQTIPTEQRRRKIEPNGVQTPFVGTNTINRIEHRGTCHQRQTQMGRTIRLRRIRGTISPQAAQNNYARNP